MPKQAHLPRMVGQGLAYNLSNWVGMFSPNIANKSNTTPNLELHLLHKNSIITGTRACIHAYLWDPEDASRCMQRGIIWSSKYPNDSSAHTYLQPP